MSRLAGIAYVKLDIINSKKIKRIGSAHTAPPYQGDASTPIVIWLPIACQAWTHHAPATHAALSWLERFCIAPEFFKCGLEKETEIGMSDTQGSKA
jgi:hypothetical protein